MADSRFIYVTYIRADIDTVWSALTTTDFIRQYFFGVTFETDWQPGSPWRMVHPDGRVTDSGEVLEMAAPHRLVLKWRNDWIPEATAEGYSRFVAELEATGEVTKLSISHAIEIADSKQIAAVSGGWPRILSNLKSLLETGAPTFAVK